MPNLSAAASLSMSPRTGRNPILEGDGQTECSPVTCVNPPAGTRKPGSVGLPVPGVEIEILVIADCSFRRMRSGSCACADPMSCKAIGGYPMPRQRRFFDDWLGTGDMGYKDADGFLFIIDRIKDLIIVNGMNVYPRMVEEVLYAHPDVVEVAVVGEPHTSHGEIAVAFVVPRDNSGLNESIIEAFCREQLRPHQRLRKVLFRSELPKKRDRKNTQTRIA